MTMKNLQKAAKEVTGSITPQEKIESLSKAFEMFSEETARLEAAYAALKQQFKELNLELENTNQQLKKKVAELDAITIYLNNILGNISQGILFIDQNGSVITYNRAAENILEVESNKVLLSSFWDNFKDDLFGFSMHEALGTKNCPENNVSTFTSASGKSYELEIDTTLVSKETNHNSSSIVEEFAIPTEGIIVLIRDITDIHHLQIAANRMDRMKELGEMAAQVAHEIRNPLGGIKGFASLLQRDLKDNPALQEMASYIIEGTDNLNRLVSQVLNYARPVQVHPEPTDIIALIKELQQHVLADASVDKDKVSISLDSTLDKMVIPLDPALFKSALLNLIVNSLQAMPNGGKITLGVLEKDNFVIVSVSDTGIGIPPENLEKIFSPFFTTKADGNGFGLAEVHKVIQGHDGSIDVTSETNKGTVFSIKLPLKRKTKLKETLHEL